MLQITKQASTQSTISNDTPEGIFKVTESLITPEVIQQVNATFLFVVDGKNPGA